MNVLIVDDNPDNLEMIGIVLKSNNYSVNTALNGKIALEMLKAEKYDLIISDILMPVMDGFKFCQECKLDENLKHITFVFYTATYIDKKDEDFALSLGAQRFIRKPQEPNIFLSIINEVVNKSEFSQVDLVSKGEKEILKFYNERLISKLEKKNQDLEGEIEAHKKTVAELIKAKEKAEESDKLKTAFLANMSHEIRTPLNTIVGFSNLMAQRDNENTASAEMAHYIDFNSKVLIKIIDDIIDISKIESGIISINKERLNIDEILLHVLSSNELTKKDLARDNVELRCKCSNETGCVIADKIRLIQILNNLISNALKYTVEGFIEVGYNIINETTVRFYVKDTGIGIPDADAPKVFTRFFKTNNDLTTVRGMGLGLSLSKDYVEQMGGEIHFESEVSKGSTFYFSLPFTKSGCDSPKKLVINKTTDLKNKHILIAEDDDGNFTLAQTVLKKAGAIVIRAENGRQAVDICEGNNTIDFVLMDIKMPVMDGIEATKIIRRTRKDLIIIAMLAYVYSGPRQNIISEGFNDFITKPIDFNSLLTVLKNI